MGNLTEMNKFIVAAIGAAITTLTNLFGLAIEVDLGMVASFVAIVTAGLVWLIPNFGEKYGKVAGKIEDILGDIVDRLDSAESALKKATDASNQPVVTPDQ